MAPFWSRSLGNLGPDLHALATGQGPIMHPQLWPHDPSLPQSRRLLERWQGEGAAFARYQSAQGPVFAKYLPLGWADAKALRRLRREITYLRDLAPLCPVGHAPHLHSVLHEKRQKAHLLTSDLTEQTWGWGIWQSDEQKEQALHDIARLLGQFHGFWLTEGQQALQASAFVRTWRPKDPVRGAAAIAAQYQQAQQTKQVTPPHICRAVQQAAEQLPKLLAAAQTYTLAHGDIHAGQVLWPKTPEAGKPTQAAPLLIDYGQTQYTILGYDLAHLLYVRLNPAERLRLQASLSQSYLQQLAQMGVELSAAEWQRQEEAGYALNVLATAQQALSHTHQGAQYALLHMLDT